MPFQIRAFNNNEDVQTLKTKFENTTLLFNEDYIQTLIIPGGATVEYEVKLGMEFDDEDFDGVRLVAYLMKNNTTVVVPTSCVFTLYEVSQPNWVETSIFTGSGVLQGNNYFFLDVPSSSLTGSELDGGPTLLLEACIVRLGKTYKNRVYVNQLGIYDSFTRLRRRVRVVETEKKDDDGSYSL